MGRRILRAPRSSRTARYVSRQSSPISVANIFEKATPHSILSVLSTRPVGFRIRKKNPATRVIITTKNIFRLSFMSLFEYYQKSSEGNRQYSGNLCQDIKQ